MPNISGEHKNNVFCILYQDKKNLLSLYNAVNGTAYSDERTLQVVTLEHAFCLSMKNDAAFVIDSRLNLYEHQSTVNENMPLRDLYYVAEELKKLAPPSQLYKRTRVQIPSPRFIVFYNGVEDQPEEVILRLSDLYGTRETEPKLELIVKQYNINSGYNRCLLENCESLKGYMIFVDKVRGKTSSGTDVETAVRAAVEECIRENVLASFFREHKDEVINMGIFEYDAELHDKVLKEESWEQGLEQGIKQGLEQGETSALIRMVCRKLAKEKSPELIARELEENYDVIQDICAVAARYAPDYKVDAIVKEYLHSAGSNAKNI